MKKSMELSWHENNLKNVKVCLDGKKEEMERLSKSIKKLQVDIDFREFQIASAKKEKKESYSSDRYKIKLKDDSGEIQCIYVCGHKIPISINDTQETIQKKIDELPLNENCKVAVEITSKKQDQT